MAVEENDWQYDEHAVMQITLFIGIYGKTIAGCLNVAIHFIDTFIEDHNFQSHINEKFGTVTYGLDSMAMQTHNELSQT